MHIPTDNALLRTRESQIADLGELAGPLAHEFNNLLNNLTLHLEIMKQKAPSSLVSDFEALHRQVVQTATQIAHFQRYQRLATSSAATIDVNQALSQAVELVTQFPPKQANGLPLVVQRTRPESQGETDLVSISLDLQDGLPHVGGYADDLRRVCRFLLNNAVRAAAVRGGTVTGRTAPQGASVLLAIEDNGPDVPTASLSRLFELGQELREGMNGLELAACRSIVRRLQGRIEARGRVDGGLSIVVTFAG